MTNHPTATPISPPQAPPASAHPVDDYLAHHPPPGLSPDGRYLTVPRVVLEQLPLPLQQHVVSALSQVHAATSGAPWPIYRVVPSRWAPIAGLNEESLAEVGILPEYTAGEFVYRNRHTRQPLSDQDTRTRVLVSCPDPLTTT